MDKLKNFIDTNREAFEDDLLPEGHFERFEQKLAVPRKSRPLRFCRGSLHRPAVPLQTAGWHAFAYSAKAGGHRPACLRGERGDRGTSSLLQYADE